MECGTGSACLSEQGAASSYDTTGCVEGQDVCTAVPDDCSTNAGLIGVCFIWNGQPTCAGDGPAFDCSLDVEGGAACTAEYGTQARPWWICARGPTCQTGCYPLLPESSSCAASDLPDTGVGS